MLQTMRATIITVIILVSMFSCDDCKDADCKEVLPLNSISARKNGMNWSGTTEIGFSYQMSSDTLFIFGLATEEVLLMKIRFNGAGTYPLLKNQGIYYTTIGGDVLTSEYKTDGISNTSALEITDYHEDEKTIEGRFDLTLKKIRSNPENAIDTITFVLGKFRGEIK
jgi:hypothetical protein